MDRVYCEVLSRISTEVVQEEALAERDRLPQYEGWHNRYKSTSREPLGGNVMGFPWDEWAPGALNKNQMGKLLERGYITYSGSPPTQRVDRRSRA
jgi:hypothetical protein